METKCTVRKFFSGVAVLSAGDADSDGDGTAVALVTCEAPPAEPVAVAADIPVASRLIGYAMK